MKCSANQLALNLFNFQFFNTNIYNPFEKNETRPKIMSYTI